MKKIITVLFLFYFHSGFSQSTFVKGYGSAGLGSNKAKIAQTYDGNYVVTANYNYDCYLVKVNPQGDTIWGKTYGGSNTEQLNSVVQTYDSGLVQLATTLSFGAGQNEVL